MVLNYGILLMKPHLFSQLVDIQRQQLVAQQTMAERLGEIAKHTKPLASDSILTQRKIYKAEAIAMLGISERTYGRYKANGLLKPRGIGHDFYYEEDLKKAMEESIRKGRV